MGQILLITGLVLLAVVVLGLLFKWVSRNDEEEK